MIRFKSINTIWKLLRLVFWPNMKYAFLMNCHITFSFQISLQISFSSLNLAWKLEWMCICRIGTNMANAGPISVGKICLFCSYQNWQASSKMFTSGHSFKIVSPEIKWWIQEKHGNLCLWFQCLWEARGIQWVSA